jgi:hypothetical protein
MIIYQLSSLQRKQKAKKQTVTSEAPAKPRGLEVIQLGYVDWEKLVKPRLKIFRTKRRNKKTLS